MSNTLEWNNLGEKLQKENSQCKYLRQEACD